MDYTGGKNQALGGGRSGETHKETNKWETTAGNEAVSNGASLPVVGSRQKPLLPHDTHAQEPPQSSSSAQHAAPVTSITPNATKRTIPTKRMPRI